MRKKITIFLILIVCAAAGFGAITHKLGSRRSYDYKWAKEIEDILIYGVQFTPTDTVPTAAEGLLYYNDSSKGLKLYDGTSWVSIDVAGASSLDTAYDLSNAITVDGSAVTLTAPLAANNSVLDVVQNDTGNNPIAMNITNTGSGDTLQFTSTGGKDIDGTSSSWSVTHAGVGSFLGLSVGSSSITMANGDKIENSTDDKYIFNTDDKEDLTLDLSQTGIVALASTTGVDTFDFGNLDDLIGIGTIAFDAAASSITLTADATGEDLTIQQYGAVDASLVLYSKGTGADSIKMYSDKGIDIDAVDDLTITNTASTDADDFIIAQVGTFDSSLLLTSAGTGADAIGISTTNASGDIKISAGDILDIDAGGKINIDAADDIAITLTSGTNGEDILITQSGANDSSIIISAAGTGADAISLQATAGTLKVNADKATINTTDDLAITVTSSTGGEDLLLNQVGANDSSITLTAAGNGADAIGLIATAGGITINSGATGINFSTDMIFNYTRQVEVFDANETGLTAAESGKVCISIGLTGKAASHLTIVLPDAAPGLTFTFVDANSVVADDLRIIAAAGDTINGGSAAGFLTCEEDSKSASCTLVAQDTTNWVVAAKFGTWTTEGP